MALGQFLLGTPQRVEQIQRFTPDQQNALSMLLKMGTQGIQDPYQGFEPIEQRARSQFQQQTIPSLAERFTSLGSNRLSSPSFQSVLGQAGAGLEEGLGALRAQYGMQNKQQSANLLNLGLTPQYENFGLGAQPGAAQPILQSAGMGLGEKLGGAAGSGIEWLFTNLLKALRGAI